MTVVVKAKQAVQTACCAAGKLGPGLLFPGKGWLDWHGEEGGTAKVREEERQQWY
jgi:hypothetical protein